MKVILLRDVPKVGRKNEIKEVSEGYARNFLFPKGFAEAATGGKAEAVQSRVAAEKAAKQSAADALVQKLKDIAETPIEIAAKANEKGHLFQGIKVGDIAKLLKDRGIEVDVNAIHLPHPIKEVGEYAMPVSVGEVMVGIVIKVVRQ